MFACAVKTNNYVTVVLFALLERRGVAMNLYLFRNSLFVLLVVFASVLGCKGEVGADTDAPDFSLSDLSGNIISLDQFRGKVVVIDFWATWCPPCRMTIPELVRLQKEHDNLIVIGVSLDNPNSMTDKRLAEFKRRFGINYRIVRGDIHIVADYFGTERVALPTIFILDKAHKIRTKIVGFNPSALKKAISMVLS